MSVATWEASVLAVPGVSRRVGALEDELRSAARMAESKERDDTTEVSAVAVTRSPRASSGRNGT